MGANFEGQILRGQLFGKFALDFGNPKLNMRFYKIGSQNLHCVLFWVFSTSHFLNLENAMYRIEMMNRNHNF